MKEVHEKSNTESAYSRVYTELKYVGRGKSGAVYLVKPKTEQKLYISKKIILDGLTEKEISNALNEVNYV